jgi:glycosyltransferase involved in cell wall biosynthesis
MLRQQEQRSDCRLNDHIVLLTRRVPPVRDGVGDYSYHLGRAIAERCRLTVLTTQGQQGHEGARFEIAPLVGDWGFQGSTELRRHIRRLQPTAVNIQWVPFMWGRFGINFNLPLTALRLRCAGYRIVTTVHEPYVRMDRWSRLVVGPLQRLQLFLLLLGSTKIITTTFAWRRWLLRYIPWRRRDIVCVAVGSNILPDRRSSDRVRCRQRLGFTADEVLLAVFSPFSAGKDLALIARTWVALHERHPNLRLAVIGADAADVHRRCPSPAWNDGVRCTGYLSSAQVSEWLLASDLLAAPFDDGVSTRRTSVVAALAHGLPVVTTRGCLTDPELFENSPIVLTDAGDDAAFIAAVERLILDGGARETLRESSLVFHQSHFSWTFIADRIANACLRT